ncbi:sulfurtransferase [Azospirillum sp. YIM DDC1]|uniref:Sulfurtransferase n=1 Tax=Azospirillum aestuarii TaxID=2802052 RepID=A0ABS1I6G3_9PROT|nr:rhodanese-like domain-containing protein [Azospirillum aestuarii]MBK4722531.1 sulfurtransferase [Azospirillum aestuarii]
MTTDSQRPLVDSAWLKGALDRPDLVVLDVRTPPSGGFIPGSIHSDYAKAGWRATVDGVPGLLPETAVLEGLIGGLGIGNGDHVVLVASGLSAADMGNATRVYWTFKTLGHDRVSVLDGGFAAWSDAGNPVATTAATRSAAAFTAAPREDLRAPLPVVAAAVADGSVPLLDSRSAEQFEGKAKSPQARVPGTLPGAVLIENGAFYSAAGKRFLPADAVKALADQAGAGDATITFCNTGHLASVAWFALSELAGIDGVRLYDGSMSEWTADPARPVKNGPAA